MGGSIELFCAGGCMINTDHTDCPVCPYCGEKNDWNEEDFDEGFNTASCGDCGERYRLRMRFIPIFYSEMIDSEPLAREGDRVRFTREAFRGDLGTVIKAPILYKGHWLVYVKFDGARNPSVLPYDPDDFELLAEANNGR